jgi:hypothetical protein
MGRLTIDDAGVLTVTEAGVPVFDPAHRLVSMLPATEDLSLTVPIVFPDFTKDYAYSWTWVNDYNSFAGEVAEDNSCSTKVTVIEQDWAAETDLATLPDGINIVFMLGRLTRTVAPSHSWGGSTIEVRAKTGVWLPWSGSVLVEAEIDMSRAFSIKVEDGVLKLHREQSVGPPPGGWGSYGGPPFSFISPSDGSGGEFVYGSAPGLGVVDIETRNSAASIHDADLFAPNYKETHRRGGSAACSTNLSTNFSSTYQLELICKLGRRPTP